MPISEQIKITKERYEKARSSIKAKGLIRNDVLGFATPKEINQCVKDKIITFRQGHYCIPMELKLILKGDNGKILRHPEKEWVVSQKFIDYMVKTGRMKKDA